VLLFLCTLAFVFYLDRVCMAQAAKPIQDRFELKNWHMSLVHMAFTLAYGLFEVPTGRWGDRIGARKILTRIAVWWSIFTALTAACWGLVSLVVIRFLFGAGEAGAYPNIARILARWFPEKQRGRVQGVMLTAALLGGAAAPALAAQLIHGAGWRATFLVFGSAGIIWASAFWFWFRDDPAAHRAVNDAELEEIGAAGPPPVTKREPIPWRIALRNPSIWLLGVIMLCTSFHSYLYFSWFPTYLQSGRGVEQRPAGWLASLVLAGGAAGNLGGGFLADRLARGGNRVRFRRWHGGLAFGLAAFALLIGVRCHAPLTTSIFAAISSLTAASILSTWWSTAIEVSGKHIGSLFGLMNSMGVIGAMGSQLFFGAFADWRGSLGYTGRAQWDPAFYLVEALLLVAALCWALFSYRPVDEFRPGS